MGEYDKYLAKSLESRMTNSMDLNNLGACAFYGEPLEKSHVKAHFRRDPKSGKLQFIKDYDDTRDKKAVEHTIEHGKQYTIDNPRSKHHGKIFTADRYHEHNEKSGKKEYVAGRVGGERSDLKPHHLKPVEDKTVKLSDRLNIIRTKFLKIGWSPTEIKPHLTKMNLQELNDLHQVLRSSDHTNATNLVSDEIQNRKKQIEDKKAKAPDLKPAGNKPMSMSDRITKAAEMGEQAFKDGKSITPAKNIELQKLYRHQGLKAKEMIQVMEAYTNAWNQANEAITFNAGKPKPDPTGNLAEYVSGVKAMKLPEGSIVETLTHDGKVFRRALIRKDGIYFNNKKTGGWQKKPIAPQHLRGFVAGEYGTGDYRNKYRVVKIGGGVTKPASDNSSTPAGPGSQAEFDGSLNKFLDGAQRVINKEHEIHYPDVPPTKLTTSSGKKYIKIIATANGGTGQKSAWGFIDKKTGDIFKATTWSQPAKHVRGNILKDKNNGVNSVTAYGPKYMRDHATG